MSYKTLYFTEKKNNKNSDTKTQEIIICIGSDSRLKDLFSNASIHKNRNKDSPIVVPVLELLVLLLEVRQRLFPGRRLVPRLRPLVHRHAPLQPGPRLRHHGTHYLIHGILELLGRVPVVVRLPLVLLLLRAQLDAEILGFRHGGGGGGIRIVRHVGYLRRIRRGFGRLRLGVGARVRVHHRDRFHGAGHRSPLLRLLFPALLHGRAELLFVLGVVGAVYEIEGVVDVPGDDDLQLALLPGRGGDRGRFGSDRVHGPVDLLVLEAVQVQRILDVASEEEFRGQDGFLVDDEAAAGEAFGPLPAAAVVLVFPLVGVVVVGRLDLVSVIVISFNGGLQDLHRRHFS